VSVLELFAMGVVSAVIGEIPLLVAICLIIGTVIMIEAFTLL
jgi:hypothetical protein